MTETATSEFVEPVPGGRIFTIERRPLLGDCAPSGRIRLDALARWLQDIAYLDVDDAGVAGAAVWVVRRTRLAVARWPRFGEPIRLETFCSGFGRMWAERRTRMFDATGTRVLDAVAIWVHLDPVSRRPCPLTAEEQRIYGPAAAGRRVTARLRHAPPGADGERAEWRFRATDCDIADHVNNAAYWLPLEEELLAGAEPESLGVEIEFRGPAQPGEFAYLRDGTMRWLLAAGSGELHASVLIDPAVTGP